MKEFDESNVTDKERLFDVPPGGMSAYMYIGAQQNHNAYKVFYEFLKTVKPKRILEIGTGVGGFAYALQSFINDLELDTIFRTYDIHPGITEKLREFGVDARIENIFDDDYKTIPQEVIDFIRGDGITIVLCDGARKIEEFKLLSEFIKEGDFILAHDYSSNLEYYQEHIYQKIWVWFEIRDSDIEEVVQKYNLKPYKPEEFQQVVWVCKVKDKVLDTINEIETPIEAPIETPMEIPQEKIDFKKLTASLTIEQKKELIEYLSTPQMEINHPELTVVTGLWNIGRKERSFDTYIELFKKFLEIPVNMFIYIPQEYEHIVWEKRSRSNTYVKVAELDYIRRLFDPFWDKLQSIRTNPEWLKITGEGGWLTSSPQANLEYYAPIQYSKMFLVNDATIWNPFNSEYFIWMDAGLVNTVSSSLLIDNRALDKIIPYLDSFLFLSFPYDAVNEVHGFDYKTMNSFAGDTVKYVCRGGLFGGKKEVINMANSTYYSTVERTLNSGCMGAEECVFTIMSYREPQIYRRFVLDGNGFISKFIESIVDDNAVLAPIPERKQNRILPAITNYELEKMKTNLYILTFNFPEQLQFLLTNMEKTPEWLTKPHLVLIDNSTDENAVKENKLIAEKYNFEYIWLSGNTGICGGRQAASDHFNDSDADFMLFFQDDMTVNPKEFEGQFCRNGFRKYIPNLYDTIHKIMMKEGFDFLKLSFTEVYFDNDKALPWYNVPQNIRTRDWPDYDKLPITGLDPNCPHTKYEFVKIYDGLGYLTGEVNYSDWPMIQSKKGNKKMFIDTKWAHPYEQTWSSHIYQLTKDGQIYSGLLLASPIWHERIKYYKPEERREN